MKFSIACVQVRKHTSDVSVSSKLDYILMAQYSCFWWLSYQSSGFFGLQKESQRPICRGVGRKIMVLTHYTFIAHIDGDCGPL